MSLLHSKMEALLWAMFCILEKGMDCQDFETDSSEFLHITRSPEEWWHLLMNSLVDKKNDVKEIIYDNAHELEFYELIRTKGISMTKKKHTHTLLNWL